MMTTMIIMYVIIMIMSLSGKHAQMPITAGQESSAMTDRPTDLIDS